MGKGVNQPREKEGIGKFWLISPFESCWVMFVLFFPLLVGFLSHLVGILRREG